MSFRVKMTGADRLQRKLRDVPRSATKDMEKAIAKSLVEVQGEAQRGIQRGSRSGRLYQKYKPRRQHRASAPGEMPKTDTGRLVSEIKVEIDSDRLGGAVGTNLDYGEYLEFGTSTMEARPWLHPTFERLKRRITARLRKAMQMAIRKVARR